MSDGTFTQFAFGISGLVDLASASDGSLYYLARGGGADTGIVSRISYTVTTPRVDLTTNGGDGPITLTPGTALQILASFDAGQRIPSMRLSSSVSSSREAHCLPTAAEPSQRRQLWLSPVQSGVFNPCRLPTFQIQPPSYSRDLTGGS